MTLDEEKRQYEEAAELLSVFTKIEDDRKRHQIIGYTYGLRDAGKTEPKERTA